MEKLISITIPTYNRAKYLSVCLRYLIPQIKKFENKVEVIICDNASFDSTADVVVRYSRETGNIKYIRNEKNLGYAGNQVKCIENATGKYIAILCDDDVYMDGLLDKMIEVISKKDYSFIALNYYSFYENPEKKIKKEFAPEKDVEFERAFDILNYPSVGHFSGYVFNSELAKKALKISLSKYSMEYFEKMRGVLFDVAVRATVSSELPSFFIGKRFLAARAPEIVDYDSLYHLCIDYYKYNLSIFKEGLTKKSDLEYRAKLVLDILPKAIISNASFLDNKELDKITKILTSYFKGHNKYDNLCYPLLKIVKLYPVKLIFRIIKILVKNIKRIVRWLKK